MRVLVALCCLGLSVGCANHQFDNPAAPTPGPDLTAPARLTLEATPGLGDHAGTATVTASVTNAIGTGLSAITVSFSVDSGTIPDTAVTSSTGVVAVTLTGRPGAAKVSARAGMLTSATYVAIQPLPPPLPPPTSAPPSPPLSPISIALVPVSATAGIAAAFQSSPLLAGASASNYAWDFGDGTHVTQTGSGALHTYTTAGIYTAGVTVTVTDGRHASASAAVTVSAPPPIPTPPAPTLTAAITCPTPSTLAISCNVTAAYGGGALPSATIGSVSWDWGDGTTSATVPLGSHTYTQAGTYIVFATVTATTTDGNKTAVTSTSITVP